MFKIIKITAAGLKDHSASNQPFVSLCGVDLESDDLKVDLGLGALGLS